MDTNIPGLLRTLTLSTSHGLMPLYEAISNASDAIYEKHTDFKNGQITIQLQRLNDIASQASDELQPINGFIVQDDGIGFTDEHLSSFEKAYTDKKLLLGGKGVGRFTYLKVFDRVNVESFFSDTSLTKKRVFSFSIADEVKILLNEPINETDTGTRVTVSDIRETYKKAWPYDAESIAKKIVTHFLISFASRRLPPIKLIDDNGVSTDLQKTFEETILPNLKEFDFTVRHQLFHVQLLRYLTNRDTHEIMYCANGREVAHSKLKSLIPNLPERMLYSDGQAYALKVLISGEFFDENLNETRTEILFNKDEEDELALESQKLSRAELNSAIAIELARELASDLKTTNEEKLEAVRNFVEEKAPEYQILLNSKYINRIESQLPVDCSEEKMDEHLLKIKRTIEDEVKKEEKEITKIIDEASYVDYKNRVEDLFEKLNDLGKANLAKHVTQRRAVLDLIEHALKRRAADDKYPLEEVIHKMVFPMRVTSKDVFLEQQNLWVIDERLSYHTLLISDKKINSIKGFENTSAKEPDILGVFFDKPVVISEADGNSGAVVVIEFKRPGRDDYPHDPTQQLTDRFYEIGQGGVTDIDGRPINPKNLRYFGYLIADLTPSLHRHVHMTHTPSADGMGYFKTLSNGVGYVEIISYDKLIFDAKKRNRILFDKLGLHKN